MANPVSSVNAHHKMDGKVYVIKRNQPLPSDMPKGAVKGYVNKGLTVKDVSHEDRTHSTPHK